MKDPLTYIILKESPEKPETKSSKITSKTLLKAFMVAGLTMIVATAGAVVLEKHLTEDEEN